MFFIYIAHDAMVEVSVQRLRIVNVPIIAAVADLRAKMFHQKTKVYE
jgi:hypothetical protein